jgi:hypothetical protein
MTDQYVTAEMPTASAGPPGGRKRLGPWQGADSSSDMHGLDGAEATTGDTATQRRHERPTESGK